MNNIYRIAFTGVFDLENYGDQLFPLIFEAEMQKRKMKFQLYLFGVNECNSTLGESRPVYAIRDLEKIHLKEKFDAIIIGGGEIIHFYAYEHKTDSGEYKKYAIYDLWMQPSIIANKYNIKLIWNAPGIPYDFEGVYKTIISGLVKPIDYLALRTEQSILSLKDCTKNNIIYCPDTGFLVKRLYQLENLKIRCKELLNGEKKFAVFHASKLMPEKDQESIRDCLLSLKEKGVEIVLLPMAYTNGDETFLSKFNALCGGRFFEFKIKLSVFDIISVLSQCEVYIGFSFHGAITAFSYGKTVYSYNYTFNRKTKDLFRIMGREEQYAETAQELKTKIFSFVEENDDEKYYLDITQKIDRHFDSILEVFENRKKKDKQIELIDPSTAIGALSEQILGYKSQIDKLLNQNQEVHAVLKDVEERWKRDVDNLQQQLSQPAQYIEALEQDIKTLNKAVEEQKSGLDQQLKYIHALENENNRKQEKIKSLDNTVEEQKKGLEQQLEYISALEEKHERKKKEWENLIDRQQKHLYEQAKYINKVKGSVIGKVFFK